MAVGMIDVPRTNQRVNDIHHANMSYWQNAVAQARARGGIAGQPNASPLATDQFNRTASGVRNAVNFGRTAAGARNDVGVGANAAANPYGYASGPGILESWFNQRATGSAPGYQYAMNRGMDAIDNRMAAGGSYNSGARGQQLSDYAANMGAQREAQLDALAGGASGEYYGRLNSMLGYGLGLANARAGQLTAYDLGAAGNMSAANMAQQQMALNSAGQQQQANQGFARNLISLYATGKSGGGGGGYGGGGYDYQPV